MSVPARSGKDNIILDTAKMRRELMSMITRIANRGWCPATSGNFSMLISAEPIRMLMSPSGIDKSLITSGDLLEIDEHAKVLVGTGQPSAESLLHAAVYQERRAACVLHGHTVGNAVISSKNLECGEIVISGYELLKGLEGVTTHEHVERVPIFENSQDMETLSKRVAEELRRDRNIKSFLLSGHGLYTWGDSAFTAYRHLEAFEFLFEVILRSEK